jgi:glyoxylase I family protein
VAAGQVAGFHHTALTVSDLDVSTAWYERVFDLEPMFQEHDEGRRASIYRFAGTDAMLGLVQHGDGASEGFDPTQIGLDHLAFTVATREAIDGWATHLTAQGVEHSGVIDIPPGAILNFRDPDGIQLAVFWDHGR